MTTKCKAPKAYQDNTSVNIAARSNSSDIHHTEIKSFADPAKQSEACFAGAKPQIPCMDTETRSVSVTPESSILYSMLKPPRIKYRFDLGYSMTVPDQSYTIPELLSRSLQGYPVNGGREPYYSDTYDFEDVERNDYDLTDLDDFINYQQTDHDVNQNPEPTTPSGNTSIEGVGE